LRSSARRSRLGQEVLTPESANAEAGPSGKEEHVDENAATTSVTRAEEGIEEAGPSATPHPDEQVEAVAGPTETTAAAIEVEPSGDMEAAPESTAQSQVDAQAQANSVEIVPSEQVDLGASGQPVDDVDALVAQAHADAHNDYLMSHLTEVAESSHPIPLDSSSFAAFMPQPPGLDPTSLASSAPVPQVPQAHGQVEVEADPNVHAHVHAHEHAQAPDPQPNVLSRLRRGPPGSCDICGRTETTVWRKLTLAGEDHKVCNREYMEVRERTFFRC